MNEVDMFTKDDLLRSYTGVEKDAGYYFFQLELSDAFDEYCLKSTDDLDLLVVSENITDREFAKSVISQASGEFSQGKVSIFNISNNKYGFTHSLVLPNTYHGVFKGKLEHKRDNLYLCVPIYRCEFSGNESAEEFKNMIQRMIPVFRWDRKVCPKIKIYFDNPETESGTDEAGALIKYPTLLSEIENLNGVSSGFIELTNYKGGVIEILSPQRDVFTLIRNRKDEEDMDLSMITEALERFLLDE
ncbi:hypothetical protein [Pseudomonas entomophila]|uniref:hypothetical protein n=1 Tax=Pseudomonas entomophila TaxID=312306 RepID=UPI0015E49090|nr:hypothetical protein [Pseudomonas entomophila]